MRKYRVQASRNQRTSGRSRCRTSAAPARQSADTESLTFAIRAVVYGANLQPDRFLRLQQISDKVPVACPI
jgi:hypothetical protein